MCRTWGKSSADSGAPPRRRTPGRVDTASLTRYRRSSCSGGISPVLGKENVRSASVDNRSRAMWLLAGLGVLIWAALSVLLGGSPAHADDDSVRPPKPVHQQTSTAQQARPATAHASPAEAQQRRAVRESAAPHKPAPQKPAAQKPAAQKPAAQMPAAQMPAAGHTIAAPPVTPPAPRASAALPQAATDRMNAATQRRDAATRAR